MTDNSAVQGNEVIGLAGVGVLGIRAEPWSYEPWPKLPRWVVVWASAPDFRARFSRHTTRDEAEAAAEELRRDAGIDAMVIDLERPRKRPYTMNDDDVIRGRTGKAEPAPLRGKSRTEPRRAKDQVAGCKLKYNPFQNLYRAKLEFGDEIHDLGEFRLRSDAIAAAAALRQQLLEQETNG